MSRNLATSHTRIDDAMITMADLIDAAGDHGIALSRAEIMVAVDAGALRASHRPLRFKPGDANAWLTSHARAQGVKLS